MEGKAGKAFFMEAARGRPEKKLNSRGLVRRQISVGIVSNVLALSGGIKLILSSMILPQILIGLCSNDESLQLTIEQGSWFASLYSIGFVFGSLSGGLQSDRMGRKISMMIDCVVMSLGYVSIALATSFPMLLFGRFIGGYATGSSMVSLPIYIGEISHPKLRGPISGMFGVMHYSGTLVLSISSAILPWRTTMFVMATIPVANLFGFLFCPESPTWLLRRNRRKDALRNMLYLRGDMSQAIDAIESIESCLLADSKETEKTPSRWESMMAYTHPSFLRPFLLLMFLIGFVQVWTGTAFINFYMVIFFKDMDIPVDPYIMSAALCLYRTVLGTLAVPIIATFKRRKVYLTLASIIFLANTSLSIHQFLEQHDYLKGFQNESLLKACPLFFVGLLYGAFAIGFGSIVRTLQGELLPADKRSFGVGFIGILEGVSVFVIAKISPYMLETIHLYGCFGFFAGVALTAVGVAYFFLPETKGVSLEEIENHFKPKKPSEKVQT